MLACIANSGSYAFASLPQDSVLSEGPPSLMDGEEKRGMLLEPVDPPADGTVTV